MKKLFALMFILIIVLMPIVVMAQDALSNMVGAMTTPEDITAPMSAWQKFLNAIEVIGLHVGFWFLVILFFGLITLLVWLPLQIYPQIKKHQSLLTKLLDLRIR